MLGWNDYSYGQSQWETRSRSLEGICRVNPHPRALFGTRIRQTRSKSVAGHTIGPIVWRRVTRRIAQSLPLGDARAAGRLSLGRDVPGALVRARSRHRASKSSRVT